MGCVDARKGHFQHSFDCFKTKQAFTYRRKPLNLNSKTLIDHFSTNKPKYILKVDTIETGMVDHYMMYGIRKINAVRLCFFNKQKLAETRSLKRYNKALFQQHLQEADWANFLTPLENEPSKMVATFQGVF